jgi:hypothetical protein
LALRAAASSILALVRVVATTTPWRMAMHLRVPRRQIAAAAAVAAQIDGAAGGHDPLCCDDR